MSILAMGGFSGGGDWTSFELVLGLILIFWLGRDRRR